MKPNYDPVKHHRVSIRLKGHDYSRGIYFITICTEGRRCIFGSVVNGKMRLNSYGKIVDDEWLNTINIRKDDVILHEYIVMPNHIHAIVEIAQPHHSGVSHTPLSHTPLSHTLLLHTPMQSPSKTLGAIVRGFKGAVSKRIGKSIWQRNYYETIIRDDVAFVNISNYIRNNPVKWKSL